jgi:CheY-like chemotaxis protein
LSNRLPLRVLVVDDNPVIRMVLVGMLEHLGAQCDVASDGNAAVAAAGRVAYELVLMDINMPGLDGAGATRAILAASEGKQAPRIVGVTGTADESRREACRRAGMSTLVLKPLRLEELARLLPPGATP